MSDGFNVNRMLHTSMTTCFEGKSDNFLTLADLTAIKCDGYNKLMIQYIITQVDSTWDRAGNIVVYGAFKPTGVFTTLSGTSENATFGILATDDVEANGWGGIYVVEFVPPWVKIGWGNTTAGSKGTISVWAIPFNS